MISVKDAVKPLIINLTKIYQSFVMQADPPFPTEPFSSFNALVVSMYPKMNAFLESLCTVFDLPPSHKSPMLPVPLLVHASSVVLSTVNGLSSKPLQNVVDHAVSDGKQGILQYFLLLTTHSFSAPVLARLTQPASLDIFDVSIYRKYHHAMAQFTQSACQKQLQVNNLNGLIFDLHCLLEQYAADHDLVFEDLLESIHRTAPMPLPFYPDEFGPGLAAFQPPQDC